MPWGGRAFTRTLAKNLGISMRDAEKLKLEYSRGKRVKNYEVTRKLIKKDMDILYQGIELSLLEMSRGEVLPQKIYFCGGGSALKGLIEGFKKRPLEETLPFSHRPGIHLLKGNELDSIRDANKYLQGSEHVTPRSLAIYGTEIESKERGRFGFGNKGIQGILH